MYKIKAFIVKNKLFIINGLIPMILFTILLLSFYPGIFTYDGNVQWKEVQTGLITNTHPFFSTFFMYLLSKIYNSITTVIIYQMILFCFIWGFLCQSIKCTKKQEHLEYIFTFIMCFFPFIGIYTITLWKDIIYTYYLFLISILLFNWSQNNFVFSKGKYI